MIKKLPIDDKNALDSAFKTSKNRKESDRIQVIRLLSQGRNHKNVSAITGHSEGSIKKLVTIYNKSGIQGLRLKPSPRNKALLRISDKEKIKYILHNYKNPNCYGLKVPIDNDFWSIPTLKLLVKKEFKLEYKSKETYRRLLKYCGFSYQKVEFEDERKSSEQGNEFKKRFEGKLKKGGRFSMWW